MVSSQKTTTDALGPDLRTLETCIRAALSEFVSEYAGKRHKLSRRSEASIINDLMVHHCESAFGSARDNGGTGGVHRSGNRRLVLFKDGQYRVKMKKLDAARRTRNIPTQAVLEFIWQAQQMAFAETPAPTNLHAGYEITDAASLTTSRVWITCPNGASVGWELELTQATAEADAKRRTAEVQPIHAESAAARRRAKVRPEAAAKRSKAAKKADGDDGGRNGRS